MGLIETMRGVMNECGYDQIRFEGQTDGEILSLALYKTCSVGVPCEPTREEKQEKMAEDIKEKSDEDQRQATLCPKCGMPFYRTGKERICPDCKKKARREATARYEAKKKAEHDSVKDTAKELVELDGQEEE